MGIIKIKCSKKELLKIICSTKGENVILNVKIANDRYFIRDFESGFTSGFVASLDLGRNDIYDTESIEKCINEFNTGAVRNNNKIKK